MRGQVQGAEKVPGSRGSLPGKGFPAAPGPQPQAHECQDTVSLMGKAGACPSPPVGSASTRGWASAFGSLQRGRGQRGVVEQWVPHLHLSSLRTLALGGSRAGEGHPPPTPALTGARPGHSYTVKSPSSFSSSEEAESNALGGSLCLGGGRIVGSSLTLQVPMARDRGGSSGPRVGVAGPGVGRGGWGFSPLQAPHLLPLVLVVVHLRAARQPLVPGLLWEWGDRVRPGQSGGAGRGGAGPGAATHRDPGRGRGAGRLRGRIVGLLGQANVSLQPAGSGDTTPETRGVTAQPPGRPPPARPHAHRHQQRTATARAAAPATEHATISTAGRGRSEGSLSGRTLPPRPARLTEGKAVTAPAPRLQRGHVHRPR